MSYLLYASPNYVAHCHRGGGISLRHSNSGWECFFQPGDDADTFRRDVAAIEQKVPENRQDDIFDMLCSEYHACLS